MSFDPQGSSTVWTTDGHVRCAVAWSHVVAFTAIAVTCLGAGFATPVAGRVLLWVAGAAAACIAARDAFVRPTLSTDDRGVVLVRTWRRERFTWAEIDAVRPYEHRRLRALELDAGESLVLVPARRLGADLADVVDALRAERLRHRG
jgi:hypothetical protein